MDGSRAERGLTAGEMVAEFHKEFGIPQGHDRATLDFRLDLLLEEAMEVVDAAGYKHDDEKGLELKQKPKSKALLKELCDIVYVAIGWAVTHGWDFDEALRRVHASNMTKIPKDGKIKRRKDGKILKPDTYKEPDLGDLV